MGADPSCPACGEPVGARATYCMHCGTEFGDGNDDPPGSDRSPAGDDGEDRLDRWFGPEGVVDDSLTVAVGVVAGVVCGSAAFLVAGVVAGGFAGLLAGPLVFLGVTGWLARQYSAFGAVRGGCYALAVALLLLPVVVLTDAAEGGTLGGQVLLFVLLELVFGVVAAFLAGVGYVAGKRRPERATDPQAGT